MKLSEMFRSEVVTGTPGQTIRELVEKMKRQNVGAVVIVESEKVVGLVTDRDIVVKVVAKGLPLETPVRDVMTQPVLTIWDDQGVFNATQYMRGRKLRRLPIIDRQERLVGLLTSDDLFALLAREILNVAEGLEPALGSKV